MESISNTSLKYPNWFSYLATYVSQRALFQLGAKRSSLKNRSTDITAHICQSPWGCEEGRPRFDNGFNYRLLGDLHVINLERHKSMYREGASLAQFHMAQITEVPPESWKLKSTCTMGEILRMITEATLLPKWWVRWKEINKLCRAHTWSAVLAKSVCWLLLWLRKASGTNELSASSLLGGIAILLMENRVAYSASFTLEGAF